MGNKWQNLRKRICFPIFTKSIYRPLDYNIIVFKNNFNLPLLRMYLRLVMIKSGAKRNVTDAKFSQQF